MTTVREHTVRFRGQSWRCTCHARGKGMATAEEHAWPHGTIEAGGYR